MSDDEGTKKQSGYRIEYSPSNRAKCSGPKPCSGTQIMKGELRMGTLIDMNGNKSFKWRHWGCTTARILFNFKNQFDEADELDGFDELRGEDKKRVRTAWAEGRVADEDIPVSARKGKDDDDEDKPKKKPAAKRKKDDDTTTEAEGKPKKKRAKRQEQPRQKRAPAKKDTDEQSDEEIALPEDNEISGSDEEPEAAIVKSVKGRKASSSKARAATKPTPASKKAKARGKGRRTATTDESGEEIEMPKDEELTGTEDEYMVGAYSYSCPFSPFCSPDWLGPARSSRWSDSGITLWTINFDNLVGIALLIVHPWTTTCPSHGRVASLEGPCWRGLPRGSLIHITARLLPSRPGVDTQLATRFECPS